MGAKKKQMIVIVAAVLVVLAIAAAYLLLRTEAYRLVRIIETEGDVNLTRGELEEVAVTTEMNLQNEDRVDVEQESYARMLLDEDKYVYAEENTNFELQASGNSENSKTQIILTSGAITTEIQKSLSENSTYEIETPNSVMAVRGTVYRVAVEWDAAGESYTTLCVFEGTVESVLIAPDGTWSDPIQVPAGKGIKVRGTEVLSEYVLTDNEPLFDVSLKNLPLPALQNLKTIAEQGEKTLSAAYEDILAEIEVRLKVAKKEEEPKKKEPKKEEQRIETAVLQPVADETPVIQPGEPSEPIDLAVPEGKPKPEAPKPVAPVAPSKPPEPVVPENPPKPTDPGEPENPPKATFVIRLEYGYDQKSEDRKVEEGSVCSLGTPKRENYGFLGWFEDDQLTRRVPEPFYPTADMTVYAGWSMTRAAYMVEYYLEDPQTNKYVRDDGQTVRGTGMIGEPVDASAYVKEIPYYVLQGPSEVPVIQSDGSTVLKLKYKGRRVTVSYYAESNKTGLLHTERNVNLAAGAYETAPPNSEWIEGNKPEDKEHYNFLRWKAGEGGQMDESGKILWPDTDTEKVIYAEWSSTHAAYQVEYYLEDPKTGSNVLDSGRTVSGTGKIGKDVKAADYSVSIMYYVLQNPGEKIAIQQGGNTVLKLYYKGRRVDVNYYAESNQTGLLHTDANVNLAAGEYDAARTDAPWIESEKPKDKENFYLGYWQLGTSGTWGQSGVIWPDSNEDKVIYAKWSRREAKYKVLYTVDGNTTKVQEKEFKGLAGLPPVNFEDAIIPDYKPDKSRGIYANPDPVKKDGTSEYTMFYMKNLQANYTVEYYLQIPGGGSAGYNKQETEVRLANIDTIVDHTNCERHEYEGYQFSPDIPGSVISATVQGDGSTILKFYYVWYGGTADKSLAEQEQNRIPEMPEAKEPERLEESAEPEVPDSVVHESEMMKPE